MKYYRVLILLLCAGSCLCQETQELSILKSDTTWQKEIITFPIDWAPGMTIKGFEDLRFAPEWDQSESEQFWSLVLAWKVETEHVLTKTVIINNMDAYFNGLMEPNDPTIIIPKTNLLLLEKETDSSRSAWIGKIKVYDNFHTQDMITLNISVVQYFCETTQSAQVVFRFSLQPFEHPIWRSLNEVKPQQTKCR